MESFIAGCLTCLVVLVIWAALGLFVSWALMLAWNLLIPALFHGPTITYFMACAMYCLVSLVGGAFRSTITTTKS